MSCGSRTRPPHVEHGSDTDDEEQDVYRPVDPTRLIGRSVIVSTAEGASEARVRAVGPAGVSLDLRGDALLVRTEDIDRLRPV